MTQSAGGPHYLLGHSEDELRRLDLQGRLYSDITLRAFRDAGIEAGMRVLDIGCGSGDVSLTVAGLVGPGGSVVGIDRSAQAVETARRKAAALEAIHVEFEVAEVEAFHSLVAFDAVVGRFVLMHQPDPVRALRTACRAVRPGGIVVMVESYMELLRTGGHSEPHSPLYDRIVAFKCDVVGGAGADLRAGGRLHQVFGEAGLPSPICRLETRVEGGAESPYYEYVERSVRSMTPEAGRLGIRDRADQALEAARGLRDEVVTSGGCLLVWPVVAAWATVPRRGS